MVIFRFMCFGDIEITFCNCAFDPTIISEAVDFYKVSITCHSQPGVLVVSPCQYHLTEPDVFIV